MAKAKPKKKLLTKAQRSSRAKAAWKKRRAKYGKDGREG